MLLSHHIALDPNDRQATYFARACGTARFAYNWALAEWQRQYKEGGKPSEAALRRQLNDIKAEQFPWMLEVTKNAPQQAIKNLGTAFKRFFTGKGKYPRFKRKGLADGFRADNGTDKNHPHAVEVSGRRVKLPVIGWVRIREPLRFNGKVQSVVVSRTADRWFVSLTVEVDQGTPVRENQAAGGVDLGVSSLATLSDGSTVDGPKALRCNLARLKRLSRSIADMGFHEFRRQLAYKAAMYGSRVVVADRWHPSSKTCSDCGMVLEALPLSVRAWDCLDCGAHHDRDVNAAKNLMKLAVSSTVTACGEEGAGLGRKVKVKPASMKQESNIEATYA